MEEFIRSLGYFAVFLGSLVEGESIIFVAGWLAHEGYLSLYKIILVSFSGSFIADQSLFLIGHFYGKPLLNKFPKFKPRTEKAFALLHKYNTLFILSFRFIYGIRTISPIVIGASNVTIKRFFILNFIAAVIWSVSSCLAAYYFASFMQDHLEMVPKIILGCLLVIGIVGYIFYKWKSRSS